jgi:hypothetical protein
MRVTGSKHLAQPMRHKRKCTTENSPGKVSNTFRNEETEVQKEEM